MLKVFCARSMHVAVSALSQRFAARFGDSAETATCMERAQNTFSMGRWFLLRVSSTTNCRQNCYYGVYGAPLHFVYLKRPATNQPAGDIQTVANQGTMSGTFKVSTYSPPDGLLSGPGKHPSLAIYTCPVRSTGSYAQCDGGICFTNTTGTTFPGLGPIASNQIVCSCPIRTPSVAYEIMAPATSQGACLPNWESTLCGVGEKPSRRVSNGTTLYIGAPLGGFQYFTTKLLGASVKLNECKSG